MKITKRLVGSLLVASTLVVPSFATFAEEVKTEVTTEVATEVVAVEPVVEEEVVKTPSNFYTRAAEATEDTTVMVEDGVVLTVGDKVDLGVLVGENNEAIRFISSDSKVATVEAVGTPRNYEKSVSKLTAVAEGEATITIYTAEGKTMTCKVTVKAVEVATPVEASTPVEEVAVTTEVVKVEAVEETKTVETEVVKAVETVVEAVEAVKTPSAFYTRVADATEDTVVTVEDGVVLTVGDKVDLGVLVGENNEAIRFISSDQKIATVEAVGTPRNYEKSVSKLTAVAEGEATITIYTAEGKTMTCKVTVKAVEAATEAVVETKVEAIPATELVPAVEVETETTTAPETK